MLWRKRNFSVCFCQVERVSMEFCVSIKLPLILPLHRLHIIILIVVIINIIRLVIISLFPTQS